MKRYDPIEFYDQGGNGYGNMVVREDGDFVTIEDYRELLAALKCMVAASDGVVGVTSKSSRAQDAALGEARAAIAKAEERAS